MRTIFIAFLVAMLLCGFLFPLSAQDSLDSDGLESLLDDYVSEDDPAVVLYVKYGDEEWVGVRGIANFDTGKAATSEDLFRIGSTTKPMTSVILLQLVDEGEINFDDPIADYLPDDIAMSIENANTATLRQLLQMTSGIFDYIESDGFNEAVDQNPSHFWTAGEVIVYAKYEEAYFPAGEDYYYSNSNYIIAQMIIESLTGKSLAENMQERIFAPLGMEDCYLESADNFAQGIVRGYQLGDENYEDITEVNDGLGLGDGGVICSAADLAKFPVALVNGLLDDAILTQMFNTVDDGEGGQYGLGISYDESDFGTQISHDGATSGFQSSMTYLPDEDLVVIILTNNFDSDLLEDLSYDAQAIALGEY